MHVCEPRHGHVQRAYNLGCREGDTTNPPTAQSPGNVCVTAVVTVSSRSTALIASRSGRGTGGRVHAAGSDSLRGGAGQPDRGERGNGWLGIAPVRSPKKATRRLRRTPPGWHVPFCVVCVLVVTTVPHHWSVRCTVQWQGNVGVCTDYGDLSLSRFTRPPLYSKTLAPCLLQRFQKRRVYYTALS